MTTKTTATLASACFRTVSTALGAAVIAVTLGLASTPALAQHSGGHGGGGGWHGGGGHGGGWHGGWHGGFYGGFGYYDPFFWGWSDPFYYYPYDYPAYPYPYVYPYGYAAPVAPAPAPSAVPQYTQAAPSMWYYCQSAKAYYPYVSSCPEAWQQVPAKPPPQ